jgi:hypothetical protein
MTVPGLTPTNMEHGNGTYKLVLGMDPRVSGSDSDKTLDSWLRFEFESLNSEVLNCYYSFLSTYFHEMLSWT